MAGHHRRLRRPDRGVVTLENVILAPALLVVLAIATQATWWYMARNAAHAAAQEGVRAARAKDAAPQAGPRTALQFLTDTTAGELTNPTADTAGTTAATVAITVRGDVPSFIPGLHLTVAQTARGPREIFTNPRSR